MARFKVDEDLPEEIIGLLSAAGHDAATVVQQRMGGWTDDKLWSALLLEQRSLITADVGFGDIRRLESASPIGIVLLRVWPESRKSYVELVGSLLASYRLDQVAGRITSVTTDSIRVHSARSPRPADGGAA